jgi:hypothetical protein
MSFADRCRDAVLTLNMTVEQLVTSDAAQTATTASASWAASHPPGAEVYALLPGKSPPSGFAEQVAWRRAACPFEETRHNCFFFRQPDAAEIAWRAFNKYGRHNLSSTAEIVRTWRGRMVTFVGDSVLRQLAEAFMCRMRAHLRVDGFVWNDATQRKVPSLDYVGMCPYGARHCELRHGCASFGEPASKLTSTAASSGTQVLRVCGFFETKFFSPGWRPLYSFVSKQSGTTAHTVPSLPRHSVRSAH